MLAFAQTPQAPAGIINDVGNFSHIVDNLERAAAFYRDVIGLEVAQPPAAFAPNPPIMDLGNTPGAQSRIATFRVPGSQLGVELIEYKDIARTPVKPRFQDPGSVSLVLYVWNIKPILSRLSSAGVSWEHSNAQSIPPFSSIFVQDADGFFIEINWEPPIDYSQGNIHRAAIEFRVEETEQTLKFWRDVLKFPVGTSTNYEKERPMDITGFRGAEFKRTFARVPGTDWSIVLREFRNIDRKKLNTKTQDPGTPILQLRAPDVDAMTAAWKAAGGEVISKGGVPAVIGGTTKIVLLRDPNGVMVEVLPAPRPSAGK